MSTDVQDETEQDTLANPDGSLNQEAAQEWLKSRGKEKDAPADDTDDTNRPGDDDSPTDDDETAPPDGKEEEGDEEDWASNEEVLELADALGISEEDMAEMGGREAFDLQAKLLTKFLHAEGERALKEGAEAEPEEEPVPDRSKKAKAQPRDKGKFAKTDVDAEEYVPTIDGDLAGEDVVKEFKSLHGRFNAALESRDAAIASLKAELQTIRDGEIRRQFTETKRSFDTIVDSLGMKDLFGESESLPTGSKAFKARAKLWDATATIISGLANRGREAGWTPAIVKQGLQFAFAQELSTRQRKNLVDKAKAQSKRKGGQGKQKPSSKAYKGPLANHPAIIARWNELQEEHGVS